MGIWDKRVKRICAGVLLSAALLRAVDGGSLAAAERRGAALLRDRRFAAFLLYLQTGRQIPAACLAEEVAPETAAPEPTAPETAPASTEETVPAVGPEMGPRRVYTPEEGESLEVKYSGDYRPDLGELISRPTGLDFSGEGPRVLIISTHATEAYAMEPGWEYTPTALARTTDTDYNVVRVAEELAEVLRRGGIGVIHDSTLNDYPSYTGSYNQARERIWTILEEYPTIQMVIDVHRDAVEDEAGNQLGTARQVLGQDSAQVMLVMGTDEGGMDHPDWEDNLSWALKIQKTMEEEAPGLARPLNLRMERFNEDLTPGSCLLEVGTAGDTLQEALTAVELFGNSLLTAIKDLG